ncbi:MAG: efflux RND transporter periplasmic adaptor subunit [Sphingomonadales bacterium]
MAVMAKSAPLRWVLWSVALCAASAVGVARAQQEPPPAPVQVATAQNQQMAPQLVLPGTVISRNDARIAAEISGRADWVAEVGADLRAGDVIARIDDRMLRLQLQENEAIIKRLQVNLRYQRQEVGRFEELAAANNIPISRLDEALSRRDMTEQDLAQATVVRERTLYQLERTKVRAPFAGRIVERLLKPGEYSSAGTDVARLADISNVEVRTQVPVALAPYIADGMMVVVDGNGEVREAPIRTMIPVADEITRMFEIRISIPANHWVIGGAVRVSVPSGTPRSVIAVPRDALILRSDNTYVFKIDGDNIAERVIVRTGAANGQFIEVLGPLQAGDKVVVRGGERLRDGRKVVAGAVS